MKPLRMTPRRLSLVLALLLSGWLQACFVGPSCDAACDRLEKCGANQGVCIDRCQASDNADAWECVGESPDQTCNELAGSCGIHPTELVAEGDPIPDQSEPTEDESGEPDAPVITLESATVYLDDNDSDTVQPGETVCLKLTLANTGSLEASGIKATVSSNSQYVTSLTTGDGEVDRIQSGRSNVVEFPNSMLCGSYNRYFKFKVAADTPVNTVLSFTISIRASEGSWSETFEVTVKQVAANLIIDTPYVYSDDNNSDTIQPGETICLRLPISNTGSESALDIVASVSTGSAHVTNLTTGNAEIGKLNAGRSDYLEFDESTLCGSYYRYFKFEVSDSTPVDTVITFNVAISSAGAGSWNRTFTITVKRVAANLIIDTPYIYQDTNNDDKVQPGETVCVRLPMSNTGSEKALNIVAAVTPQSGYVTDLTTGDATEASLGAGRNTYLDFSESSLCGSYYRYYRFSVAPSTPVSTNLNFNVAIQSDGAGTWQRSFSILVQ